MAKTLLQLKNFQLAIGGQTLFAPISFAIDAGEVVLLLGPNGVGKSSLMRCLSGQPYQFQGEIDRFLATKDIVYQSQSHNLSFHLPMTIGDAIKIGTGIKDADLHALGLVDSHLQRKSWNTASGGERQRALISRSLLLNPALLLLDEPFNHMDQSNVERVLKRIGANLDQKDFPGMIMTAHGTSIPMLIDAFNPKIIRLVPCQPSTSFEKVGLWPS
jgi:zinc/manganese transport system ATP-binding protein/zinc transport system ATP-binding protein